MESEAYCVGKDGNGAKTSKMTSKEKRPIFSSTSSSSPTMSFRSSGGGSLNFLMCGLCVLSFTASGYFSYRETLLESRLGALEAQFAAMRAGTFDGGNNDVIVERLRREVEARFQQRMTREVASGRRLLMDVAASQQQQAPLSLLPQKHARTPRDISECVCPPEWKKTLPKEANK